MAASATPVPASGRPDELPSFFRHHGLMAPGIRLFRRIGFPGKAAIVTVAFLLPLLVLAWSFWSSSAALVDSAQRERIGVVYLRALMPVLDLAQQRRRAAVGRAADAPEVQRRLDAAWQALAERHAASGAQVGAALAWQRLVAAREAVDRPAGDGTDAVFAAHTAVVDALLALLQDVADGSELSLDPEVDTYYLMLGAAQSLPALAEELARMRGLGLAVLRAGAATPAQHDALVGAVGFAGVRARDAGAALQRATAADPALGGTLGPDAALGLVEPFRQQVRQQLLGEAVQGDPAALVAQGNAAVSAVFALVDRTLGALDAGLARRVARLQSGLALKLGLASASIALAVYLLVAFYRVTQGGITEVARQLRELSRGNLTLQPRPWGRDEVAQLMVTLDETLVSLRRTVARVRDGAAGIQTASQEVAAASQDLARRTDESAAHLQRTAGAMARIEGTVQHSAQVAEGAARLVADNAAVARRGGEQVAAVVATMGEIRQASDRIAAIVGTIDGIAFQTNILALNAAVEAARAGEAGRGFAVVAAEVRALAQRSGAAAREVKSLIGASLERVEVGGRAVGQTGTTMTDVVGHAQEVRTLMDRIRDGAAEQTTGLAGVFQSVGQLEGMTQQNAALVEQTAAAAASLEDNAGRLNQEMAFFRLP